MGVIGDQEVTYFYLGFWDFFEGPKWGFPQKISYFFSSVRSYQLDKLVGSFNLLEISRSTDLEIILAFLAAETNLIILSAKVRDFSTLSSAPWMLSKGSYHYNSCTLALLQHFYETLLKHYRNTPKTSLKPPQYPPNNISVETNTFSLS